ncbi:diguanylate cyclase [Neiella marina]|uniref:diguanylate cyclase n=1 Tax=Neiella holothuriorum TaxID=2870530 RepID=A0ABS7EI53_9GAMM|nr:GGDEF domain-containing protein [Neiella holothuriorum]MBW8191900.1 diguanylate cyclase [Neiella holothuriorum]
MRTNQRLNFAGKALRAFCITLSLIFACHSLAAEGSSDIRTRQSAAPKVTSLSLLKQAKASRHQDPKASAEFAQQALKLAQAANEPRVEAQAHELLAKLAKKAKEAGLAKFHFRRAAEVFEALVDPRKQIENTIDYIKLLYHDKSYQEGTVLAAELLAVAQQLGNERLLGLVYFTKGNGLFKQKDDQAAVAAYKNAVVHLNGDDSDSHALLASVHYQLAQSSEHLHDDEQAKHSFFQAASLFEKVRDADNRMKAVLGYVDLLYEEQDFAQGIAEITKALDGAEQLPDERLLALAKAAKGDGFYNLGKFQNAIDELTQAATLLTNENSKTNKRLASIYRQIGQSFKQLNETDKSLFYFRKSLDIYQTIHDPKAIARLLKNIATGENRLRNYIAALSYANRSLALQQGLHDTKGNAELLMLIGMIYRNIGHYEKSLDSLQKALQIYEQEGDISNVASTWNQIGLIYSRLEQFDNARSFYQKSIDQENHHISQETRAAAFREIAVIDYEAGAYDDAMAMLSKAEAIYRSINDPIKSALVNILFGKVYLANGRDALAKVHFEQSLALSIEVGDLVMQTRALIFLGRLTIETDTDKSIRLLKQALELASQSDAKDELRTSYSLLKEAEKVRGHLASALYYAEQEIAVSKLIHREQEEAEFVRAKAKLDSHKMEMDLSILREKVKLDALKITQKNNEIEIVRQANKISELELTKNQYANLLLAILLVICLLVAVVIYRSFVASRRRNRELDYLAARDPLTDCYNRRVLFERLNRDFEDLALIENYSIILADVDHFKTVNDTYGHSAGDGVLRAVAQTLRDCTRKNDTVARFGGEEFCILLPSATADQAMRIAEQMRERLEKQQIDHINVTCSFGVSALGTDPTTPAKLIDEADLALYRSKSEGRNQVTLWQSSFKGLG